MTLLQRSARLTGPELRERRRDLEVTQEQLAARLGVTRPRVAHIEALAEPRPALIRRYLAGLAELEAQR